MKRNVVEDSEPITLLYLTDDTITEVSRKLDSISRIVFLFTCKRVNSLYKVSRYKNAFTPLCFTIHRKHPDLLEWFVDYLKYEVKSTRRGTHQRTLSRSVLKSGNTQMVKYIIETKEFDCNEDDCNVLAKIGQFELFKWFIGYYYYAVNEDSCKAAVKGGHLPILKYILQSGHTGCYTERLTKIAIKKGHTHIVDWLKEYALFLSQ